MSWQIKRFQVDGFQGYRSISFDLRAEPNFFVGINGSGKTTLIELLNAALNIDRFHLARAKFDRIVVEFSDHNTQDFPTIHLWRSVSDKRRSKTTFGEVRSASSQEPLSFVLVDEGHWYSPRSPGINPFEDEHDEIQNYSRYMDATSIVAENVNCCWLSIHRGVVREEFDDEGEFSVVNPVDQKLRDLMNDTSHYFSSLDNQSARLTQDYQKSFFLSLLESRPQGVSSMDDSVIEYEKTALTRIFLEFGLTKTEFGRTLDEHFERVRHTNDWLK